MDLDAREIPVYKLQEKVGEILASVPFKQILQAKGIRIDHVSYEQTETTQRWKLGLIVPRMDRPLPTKIEFSRRGMSGDVRFEAIDPLLIGSYDIQSILANHYPKEIAYQQKLGALIDRKELQARDVFDLHLLLNSGVKSGGLPEGLRSRIGEAKNNALAVSFDAFAGQVLAYLSPEDQAMYDEGTWDSMRLKVLEALEEADHEAH